METDWETMKAAIQIKYKKEALGDQNFLSNDHDDVLCEYNQNNWGMPEYVRVQMEKREGIRFVY